MARRTPQERQRDPERTKARILSAATSEFAAHGYAGARVGEIASRAGVNKQLISYYFGGKEGLYREITERWLRSEYAAQPSRQEMPLAELVTSFITQLPEDWEMARLLIWEGLEEAAGAEHPGDPMRSARMRAAVDDLRRRQAAGELPETLDVRFFLLVSMAIALAPISLPHVARSIYGAETDSTSPEFLEKFVEQYRTLVELLGNAEAK